jgi:hypothetical protein
MTATGDERGRPPTFAQRYGYAPMPEPVQLESLDERTRTDLWNVLRWGLFERRQLTYDLEQIWWMHFGRRRDGFIEDRLETVLDKLVFQGEWHEVYNFLDFLAAVTPDRDKAVIERLNDMLGYNRAGYRIVGREVVPITDDTELEAIRSTLSQPTTSPTRQHLEKALQLFADRDNPQYANSIKESISAVESAARDLSGNPSATLGNALDLIAKQGNASIHAALLKGWKGIYGFTSDSGGIRHADYPGSVPATQALAQYFLVTCSAMVNYLTSLKTKP